MNFVVTIEVVRVVERAGKVHQPGERIRVPIDEAHSMLRSGFARPIDALASWGISPAAAWVKAWRKS
jgi:hypothetical protein